MIYSINFIINQLLLYHIKNNDYHKFKLIIDNYHNYKEYDINYKLNGYTILAILFKHKKTHIRKHMIKLLLYKVEIQLNLLNDNINYLEYAVKYNDNDIIKLIYNLEPKLLNFYVLESSKKNSHIYHYFTNKNLKKKSNIEVTYV